MATYISLGSPHHLSQLQTLSRNGRSALWTVNAKVEHGDTIVIYLRRPVSAFVAVGHVESADLEPARKWKWPRGWMGRIRVDAFINPPLPLARAQRLFPHWQWLFSPRTHAHVPGVFDARLLSQLGVQRARGGVIGANDGSSLSISAGGGFGSIEQNRKTEAAAIRFLKSVSGRPGGGFMIGKPAGADTIWNAVEDGSRYILRSRALEGLSQAS